MRFLRKDCYRRAHYFSHPCCCDSIPWQGSEVKTNKSADDVYRNIELFTEVLRQVEENYVEPQDTKKLIEGAIKGMMQSLDPHSTYMTKEEHDDLRVKPRKLYRCWDADYCKG
jgi:C-terminal processing protease CtpA/Prc